MPPEQLLYYSTDEKLNGKVDNNVRVCVCGA